tara:strand:+ start:342 stop:593 length:252 start_codon:yes stop_codon:yes gene_type:complete
MSGTWERLSDAGNRPGYCFPQASKQQRRQAMARLVNVLVSMFGPRNSAQNDILTFVKTEYRNEWQTKYNQLLDEYNRTGAWKL